MSTLKSALDSSSNLEPISNSLRSIKLIRSNVKDLFKLLADGNQNAFDQLTDDENSQNKFVNDVQILMNNINKRLIELETSAVLAQSNISSSINLGNAASLGLDPNQERQQLYNSMIQSYRWYDKLTDAAIHANSILSLNHLKRTSWVVFQRNRALAPKKQLTTGFNVPPQNVEATINIINKPLGLKIEYDYSLGDSLLLKITLERVLKGVILLRGYIIEWVNVKGVNEEFLDLDDNLDIWTESKYEVFRKVTDHMNTSMLHHTTPLHSEQALRSFLIWFKSYYNLFDKECKKCGNKLRNYLPPTWRDLRTYESYHFHCI